jgi:8-oxo-dGTP pyrophosphatase MutT (NUDIX family)
MLDNIICSGALFYAIDTKRFLFLQRNEERTRNMWGLVGGRMRYTESAFEGLKREIQEEISYSKDFKKVIPLELFTSNDQKFFFHTYVVCVNEEFLPRLNEEHSSYAWCAFECWPKNLHAGLRNTLNNKSIKGKLQTILDLIV